MLAMEPDQVGGELVAGAALGVSENQEDPPTPVSLESKLDGHGDRAGGTDGGEGAGFKSFPIEAAFAERSRRQGGASLRSIAATSRARAEHLIGSYGQRGVPASHGYPRDTPPVSICAVNASTGAAGSCRAGWDTRRPCVLGEGGGSRRPSPWLRSTSCTCRAWRNRSGAPQGPER